MFSAGGKFAQTRDVIVKINDDRSSSWIVQSRFTMVNKRVDQTRLVYALRRAAKRMMAPETTPKVTRETVIVIPKAAPEFRIEDEMSMDDDTFERESTWLLDVMWTSSWSSA